MTLPQQNDALKAALVIAEDALRLVLEGEPGDYPLHQHHLEEMLDPALDAVQQVLGEGS